VRSTDVGVRPSERIKKSADADPELDIAPGLHSAAGNCRPLEKSYCEAVLTAADFRIELAVVGETYPQKAATRIFLHAVLVHAVDGDFVDRLGTFPDQPEQFDNCIADRANNAKPIQDVLLPPGEGLAQPVAVFRQVEFAGAARYSATMFDRAQELTVFQGLQEVCTGFVEFTPASGQARDHGFQPSRIDLGLTLEALQYLDLTIQLLMYVTADVAARQNGHDLKQARGSRPCGPIRLQLAVVEHLLIEEFDPHEGSHALINRLLIFSQPFCGGWR